VDEKYLTLAKADLGTDFDAVAGTIKLEKQGIVIGMMPARQVYADAIAGQALLDLVYFCDERSGR
jgi:hypothetical protein